MSTPRYGREFTRRGRYLMYNKSVQILYIVLLFLFFDFVSYGSNYKHLNLIFCIIGI
jgi:hypothetical protein